VYIYGSYRNIKTGVPTTFLDHPVVVYDVGYKQMKVTWKVAIKMVCLCVYMCSCVSVPLRSSAQRWWRPLVNVYEFISYGFS